MPFETASRRPVLYFGTAAYLLFSSLVWTPLGGVALLWPFVFVLSLQRWFVVSAASRGTAFTLDLVALVIVIPWLVAADAWVGRRHFGRLAVIALSLVAWYVPLLLIQAATYVVVRLLGYPVGF